MPSFDRIDGRFVAKCAFSERFIFRRAGWIFSPDLKAWTTVDVENARKVQEHAVNNAREFLDSVNAIRDEAVKKSWAEDTDKDYPAPEGLHYMPFQKAGIEYAIARANTLFADPPGLGKTIQAIGVHNTIKPGRVLILCPASLKVNWAREWRKWDVHGSSIGIAMSIPKRRVVDGITNTWTEYDWPDTDVVIVNYDMMDTFDDQIKSVDWGILICDESHLLKSPSAIRTKCVFGGKVKKSVTNTGIKKPAKEYTPVKKSIGLFLTGTPVMSRPEELWTIIRACDRNGLGKDKTFFHFEYCGAWYDGNKLDTSGSSNLDELNRLLRERFMVRRDKRAVLNELPDKTREPILLPKDKLEAPLKKEKKRVEKALEAFEEMLGISGEVSEFRFIATVEDICGKIQKALDEQKSEEPDWNAAVKTLSAPDQILFTEISAAREEVALAKVGLVVEHIIKLVDSEEPVVVFAYHKSVIREIRNRLEVKGVRVGVITGDVSPNKRQGIVDAYQNGDFDVILGNLMAMGVGFTLTRGRFVVFAELDWVPAMIEQGEDRAWRHGQKNAVIVQHLIVDGSIESRMAMALLDKMDVIWKSLDKRY